MGNQCCGFRGKDGFDGSTQSLRLQRERCHDVGEHWERPVINDIRETEPKDGSFFVVAYVVDVFFRLAHTCLCVVTITNVLTPLWGLVNLDYLWVFDTLCLTWIPEWTSWQIVITSKTHVYTCLTVQNSRLKQCMEMRSLSGLAPAAGPSLVMIADANYEAEKFREVGRWTHIIAVPNAWSGCIITPRSTPPDKP